MGRIVGMGASEQASPADAKQQDKKPDKAKQTDKKPDEAKQQQQEGETDG
ncbi:MAG: hypothetical protein LBD12_02005 [Clostridiales Family XIII bacterium]|jgi:hypothetical protein|nr:hypothetical protein [Clostridiales Family XIII bacterium]